jgi:protein-tyrosine-phosphatase
MMRRFVCEAGVSHRVLVDSAGVAVSTPGRSPYWLAVEVGIKRGFHLVGGAKQFGPDDYDRFDFVLAADAMVHERLRAYARGEADLARLHFLRAFDPASGSDREIPDPLGGTREEIERVFDLCEPACRGLLVRVLT